MRKPLIQAACLVGCGALLWGLFIPAAIPKATGTVHVAAASPLYHATLEQTLALMAQADDQNQTIDKDHKQFTEGITSSICSPTLACSWTDAMCNFTDSACNPTSSICSPTAACSWTDAGCNATDRACNPTSAACNPTAACSPTDRFCNVTDRSCNPTDRSCNATDRFCSPTERSCNPTEPSCDPTCTPPPRPRFIRGICGSNDSHLNIANCLFGLNYLFAEGRAPPCEEACDFNKDGRLTVSDAVHCVRWLFQMGSPPVGWVDHDGDGLPDPTCETAGAGADCRVSNPACEP